MTRRALRRWASGVVLLTGVVGGARAWALQSPAPSAASPSTVKVPDGPGSVRGLADPASVNVFSAQVGYQIPIALPSGRAGFGPRMAIAYSGELGNGPLGIGFSLGQIAIRRSLRHGVPAYGARDELELIGVGGGGRLIRDAGDLATYWLEGHGHDVRVRFGAGGFVVTDAEGVAYRLGATEAGREGPPGVNAVGDDPYLAPVAGWLVEEIQDLAGQVIAFSYLRDEGMLLLRAIVWGPDGAATKTPVFRADFSYEARPDVNPSHRAGYAVQGRQRLREIAVHSFGETLRSYHLEYEAAFRLSRLARVTMRGRGGKDGLPPVSFGYPAAVPPAARAAEGIEGWVLNQRGVSLCDVDGDGMNDLLRLEANNQAWKRNRGGRFEPVRDLGGAPEAALESSRLMDLDGDARADLVRVVGDVWRVRRLEGALLPSGWQAPVAWAGSELVSLADPKISFADVNGDGSPDVLEASTDGLRLRLVTVGGVAPVIARAPIDPNNLAVTPGAANVQFGDANGDGLADVLWLTDAAYSIYLGRGDGTFVFQVRNPFPWGDAIQNLAEVRLADLNRDGLIDLVRATAGHVHFHAGLPGGRFEPFDVRVPRPENADADAVLTIADANGNGSQDVVWSSPRGLWILDLAGPTSAGMLARIDNGMGLVTSFAYEGSAVLAVNAEAAQAPWERLLPVAIPVPVEIRNEFGSGEPPRVTVHTVRDGAWDPVERRFAGFLGATTIAVGARDDNTLHTRAWFAEGVGLDRSLRGRMLREEIRDGVGRAFAVNENVWLAAPVAGFLPEEALSRRAFLQTKTAQVFEGVVTPLTITSTFTPDPEGRTVREEHQGRTDLSGDEKIVTRAYADDAVSGVRNRLCEERTFAGDGTTLVSFARTIYGDHQKDAVAAPGQSCGVGRGLIRRGEDFLQQRDPKSGVDQSRFIALAAHDYDAWGNVTRSYADGISRWFAFDPLALRVTSETLRPADGIDLVWTAAYDDVLGAPITLTDPNGDTTRITHDDLGRPTAIGIGMAPPHIRYLRDWTAPRPRTTTWVFDGTPEALKAAGMPPGIGWRESIAVSNSAGQDLFSATRLQDDRFIISGWEECDERGQVNLAADAFYHQGVELPVVLPSGGVAVQRFVFDAAGRLREQSLPTGGMKKVRFEPLRETVTASGLAPVVSEKDGFGRTIHTYREIAVEGAPVREGMRARYDAADRPVEIAIEPGAVLHAFSYDLLGRMVGAHDPDIGARRLEYDDRGLLVRHENGAGQVVRFGWDGAGRLTARGPDGTGGANDFAFQYDVPAVAAGPEATKPRGRLAAVREPGGGEVLFGYDEQGRERWRRRTVAVSGAARVATEARVWSPSGLLLRKDFDDGFSLAMSHDGAGRAVSVGPYWSVAGEGGAVGDGTPAVDAAGRPLRAVYGNGIVQTWQRDAMGLPGEINLARGAQSLLSLRVVRNLYGAPTLVTDGDGRGLDHSATYSFDDGGRLRTAAIGAAGNAHSFGYRYDGLQNLIERTVSGPSALGVFSGVCRHGENGAGPRQLTSIVPAVGGVARLMGYDKAGRQTADGGRRMIYDGFDQLMRVRDEAAGMQVDYGYGYEGFRTSAQVAATRGKSPSPARTDVWFSPDYSERNGHREHLVMAGQDPIARVIMNAPAKPTATAPASVLPSAPLPSGPLSSGPLSLWERARVRAAPAFLTLLIALALLAAFTPTARASTRSPLLAALALTATTCASTTPPPAGLPTNASVTFLHAGVAPGPALITDRDGNPIEERRYEPFGEPIDSLRAGATTPVPGANHVAEPWNSLNKETDATTGWSYHGARWMVPGTARWLSPDPPVKAPDAKHLAMPWDLNPYQYVRQNPTLYWDPDGEESVSQLIERMGRAAYAGGSRGGMFAWAAVGALWEAVGAESVSRVADSHITGDTSVGVGDYVMAAVETTPGKIAKGIVTLAKPVAAPVVRASAKLAGAVGEAVAAGAKAVGRAAVGVTTPRGLAVQAGTPVAKAALADARAGATLYRQGTFGVQETTAGQFWSLRNPLATTGYAKSTGLPGGSAPKVDWVMGGSLKEGATAITRGSPGVGTNVGGAMEVVTTPGGVGGLWFHMP